MGIDLRCGPPACIPVERPGLPPALSGGGNWGPPRCRVSGGPAFRLSSNRASGDGEAMFYFFSGRNSTVASTRLVRCSQKVTAVSIK